MSSVNVELQRDGGHMSYLVLARKWHPRNFARLVGQQHVARAISARGSTPSSSIRNGTA